MKRIKLIIAFLGILLFAHAEIRLPAIFSDNMLMQQNALVNIWGKADANKTIIISTSWNKNALKTTADTSGNWKASFQTPKTDGKAQTITLNDGNILILKNILLGELWLCSGQSNMEMPMKGFKNQPVEGANMDILRSTNQAIRLFTVKRSSTILAQTDVTGKWEEATPETVKEFSATGYYFGRLLNQTLNIPVGLILSAWGGSCV